MLGWPVYLGRDDEAIGEVQDVIVAPDGRVKALVIVPLKGLMRKPRAVPIAEFAQLGPTFARLKSGHTLSDAREALPTKGMYLFEPTQGLCGRSLLSDAGEEIGTIGDVVLETDTLSLWGFEVSDGLLNDLLDGRLVVEAAGATRRGDFIVLNSNSDRHMNLDPEGHPTP